MAKVEKKEINTEMKHVDFFNLLDYNIKQNNQVKISICIPNYNRSEKLIKLLNDIFSIKG